MRVLLVDLAIVWERQRAIWEAKGEPARAVEMTDRQLSEIAPDYDAVAICIDSPPYKRAADYPDYKGQREPRDPLSLELYKTLGGKLKKRWPILHSKGYEADDIVATACRQLVGAGHQCTIVSADKDLYQCLVDGSVDLINPATTPGNDPLWTAARFTLEKGLLPCQVPLYLALMGDTADNIPGIKGIGDKGAKAILAASKAFKPVGLKAEHMTDKQWQTMLATRDPDLELMWRLTTLDTAPIDAVHKLGLDTSQPARPPSEPAGVPIVEEIPMEQEQEQTEDDDPIAAMGGPVSASLDGALLEAQRLIRGVRKGSRNDYHRYNYASAEDMIAESRKVLLAAGLVAPRESWSLAHRDSVWIITSTMRIAHPVSGESRLVTTEYPIVPEKGRPLDKAANASLSTSYAYWLRDLLQIPRVETEVCARDDNEQIPQAWQNHRRDS